MQSQETASRYDRLAEWWQTQHQNSSYGLAALARAIRFVAQRGAALDVGCGSSGRFITHLAQHGFQVEGLDVSREMIRLAQRLHPAISFTVADICEWTPPRPYSLIAAWDSIFHLPLDRHAPVLEKLCAALEPGGVLLFTGGGGHTSGEVTGSFQGQEFAYSTVGVDGFLHILMAQGCTCRHLEYDQYPEKHVYFIAQKCGSR
jgi:SAM-dependent methyltransferase